MKKNGLQLVAVVVAFIAGLMVSQLDIVDEWLGGESTKTLAGDSTDSPIARAQRMAADELRSQLPMRMDDYTIWRTVISAGPTLLYGYDIEVNRADINVEEFKEQMEENVVASVCQIPDMTDMMDQGAVYRYMYMSLDGLLLAEFEVTSERCIPN